MEYTNPDLPEDAVTALSEIEKQFIQMRSSGLPIRKIAKNLNKSTRTICMWNKKFYRNIVELNSDEFKILRNKIVEFKTARLDFLIGQFKNIKEAMEKSPDLNKKNNYSYENFLELTMKISKLIEKYEADLLIPDLSHTHIEESKIIDAENVDLESTPEVKKLDSMRENSENIVSQNDENIENNVVQQENNAQNVNAEHIDNS